MAINTIYETFNLEDLILKIANKLLRFLKKVINHAEEICKIKHGR